MTTNEIKTVLDKSERYASEYTSLLFDLSSQEDRELIVSSILSKLLEAGDVSLVSMDAPIQLLGGVPIQAGTWLVGKLLTGDENSPNFVAQAVTRLQSIYREGSFSKIAVLCFFFTPMVNFPTLENPEVESTKGLLFRGCFLK